MLYHVVRRPPNQTTTNSSNPTQNNHRSGSVPPSTLMPRYHYSRNVPNSATYNSDSLPTRNHFDTKPTMTSAAAVATTTTTTTNNNNTNPTSYGSFKSTIIPFVANNRTTTPNKREFVQIPVNREDINNPTRSVPISFSNETNLMPPTGSNNNNNNNGNGNLSPRPTFTNLLRPTSKYFQYQSNNSTEDPTINKVPTNIPRLPSVSRRLSLTIPVTATVVTNTDDEIIKPTIPSSSTRQIPIRLPATLVTSTPSPRTSSAILRALPISNGLQRQKTDIGDGSLSSPALSTINHPSSLSSDFNLSSPIRRAEVMAREAIQGISRLQQQQRNSLISEPPTIRSPTLSRRVIINLKNNQSISLDSRLSSAMKPPPSIPSSSRTIQRNNLYHIPVLHEIQMSSHPTTNLAEHSTHTNNSNYKNEFHMEIPVTIVTSNDQENQMEEDHHGLIRRERFSSANNQTLKSILKRSSSRETVSRKNVSFMNA